MKRVAISQRRDTDPNYNEVRDCLDIRFAKLLWEWGFLPLPLASGISNPNTYLHAMSPDAIVLTGGNDIGRAPERDALETAALDYALCYQLPVLGICRGLQMLNHYQGGQLRSISGHVATQHTISGPLTQHSPRTVNSYHKHAVYPDTLGNNLRALAWVEDGSIEALCHTTLPWLAIMWHPERDSPLNTADKAFITKLLTEGRLP